jgi:ribonuclease HI
MSLVEMTIGGLCDRRSGLGQWTAALGFGSASKKLAGSASLTTSQRMDLTAAISGLRSLKRRCAVELYTTSQYLALGAIKLLPIWSTLNERHRENVRNNFLWDELHSSASRHDIQWHLAPVITRAGDNGTTALAVNGAGKLLLGGSAKLAANGSAKPPLVSTCKKCNAEITWLKQSNGKWIPTNEFGESHFQSCKRPKPSGISSYEVVGRTAGEGADVGFLYCGEIAPWYAALGDYRPYNTHEIADQIICSIVDTE